MTTHSNLFSQSMTYVIKNFNIVCKKKKDNQWRVTFANGNKALTRCDDYGD